MNILDEIIEVKKEEVKELRKKYSIKSFSEFEFYNLKSISLFDKIKSKDDISIIAEIKKASPSKGIIRENFNHFEIAEIYFKESVDAVSVLTDKKFFMGSINFLNDIAKIKDVPLLRKDFIIDEYQIFEAKAFGADIVLLICEALSKSQIKDLTLIANEIGLEVLLELHSQDQLEKINFEINKLIGANNRNLKDFSVDLSTTAKISNQLPKDIILVSESGIKGKEDIDYLRKTNASAVLVGEQFMSSKNIQLSLEAMKDWCSNES